MSNAYQTLIAAEASLIHWYKMDETSSNVVVDGKGSTNGTYNGTPLFSAANLAKTGIPAGGTAVQFGGTGSNSTWGSIGAFTTGGTGETLEAWVYITGNPGAESVVASHDNGSTLFPTYLAVKSTGIVRGFFQDGGGGHEILSTGSISLNIWHHLVVVAPTSGTAHLYVDGVAQTAGTACGTPVSIATAIAMGIGAISSGGSPLACKIDEVAVYNSGLVGASVLAHYNAGITAPGSRRLAGIGGGLAGPYPHLAGNR